MKKLIVSLLLVSMLIIGSFTTVSAICVVKEWVVGNYAYALIDIDCNGTVDEKQTFRKYWVNPNVWQWVLIHTTYY